MNFFQKFTLLIEPFFVFEKKKKDQRIELFSFRCDPKNWTFFQFDSKNCLLLRNITRWIESFFFFQYYSKTWAFFSHNMTFKNWTFLKNMTQRIELFKCDLEPRIILQFDSNNWIWLKALNPPFQYDSKNWTFFSQMTRRLELSFTNMSDRIKLFFLKKRWLEELIFWKYQSNYTNFILMTQRIEFFFFEKHDS